MKKSSVRTFTRKCLKLGYKESVCKNAWVFGKTDTEELNNLYNKSFKGQKQFCYTRKIKTGALKYAEAPSKITGSMLLKASGPRIFPEYA
jgi:hypothetical protein